MNVLPIAFLPYHGNPMQRRSADVLVIAIGLYTTPTIDLSCHYTTVHYINVLAKAFFTYLLYSRQVRSLLYPLHRYFPG